MSLLDKASRLALGWLVFAPYWVITVAALGWGRRALSGAELRSAVRRTGVWSVAFLLPLAWGGFTYLARFNPQPTMTPLWTGALVAVLFLPVYSGLAACAAFEPEHRAAEGRGSPRRPMPVRMLASTIVALAVICGVVALFVAAMMAAGPKALG